MVFPVIGGDGKPTGYEIENSLRFNDGDNPKLQISTGSNSGRKKMTFSCWFKVSQDVGEDQTLISWNDGGHAPHIKIDNTSEQINFRISDSGSDNVMTSMSFRDPSAWYHLVVVMDTTQSTDSNRVKIYVNGVLQTSLATANYVDQNTTTAIMSNTEITIGRDITNDNKPFDGYMAEIFLVDGTAYDASYFGETNDNGVWIPKDAKGDLTFGTHGAYFEFKQTGTSANSSGIGADTSGNDNHYAVTNLAATDITVDTPTNNFCTLSSVDNDGVVLSEGNCNFDTSSGSNEGIRATIGVQNGKWYYECKITNSAGLSAGNIGYANSVMQLTENPRGGECAVINGSSSIDFYNNNSSASTLDASDGIGQNDIIGVALDLDSGTKTIQFYKNGSTISSAQTIASDLLNDFLLPCMFDDGGVNDVVGGFNFGNPAFSISSGNSDANGYGNFEYAVPSGFFALCTKNLAEYG